MSQPRCLISALRISSRRISRRKFTTSPTWQQFVLSEQQRKYTQTKPKPAATTTATAESTEAALQIPKTEETIPSLEEFDSTKIDWSKSFHGLSSQAFPQRAADILLASIDPEIVEIKPDGICYLPEIHYRRILNRAFGPGAWGLAPRGETIVTDKAVTREYALVALGR